MAALSFRLLLLRSRFRFQASMAEQEQHPSSTQILSQVSLTEGRKRCLRCNNLYLDKDNSPIACSFHGHITGERGLFALSPPHQGIDGDWSDRSGVIVYRWNEKGKDPTQEDRIGENDGVAVKNAMKILRLVAMDGTFAMMMASLCTDFSLRKR